MSQKSQNDMVYNILSIICSEHNPASAIKIGLEELYGSQWVVDGNKQRVNIYQ